MLGRNKHIFTNYDVNIKFLALTILGLLFLSFIFLFFYLDQYANIVMSFIFFILFVMVLLQLREYYLNPHTFKDNIENKNQNKDIFSLPKSPVGYIKDVKAQIKKQHGYRWPKIINTFLIIIFFLVYGVNTPTKDNWPGFILLVIILVSLNLVLFYFSFGQLRKKSIFNIKELVAPSKRGSGQHLFGYLVNKNSLMIGIINFSAMFVFVAIFGFNLDHYLKFVAIGFIMILINSLLISDVRHPGQYE